MDEKKNEFFFFPQNSAEEEKRENLIRRRSRIQDVRTRTEPTPAALLDQMDGEVNESTNVFHYWRRFHSEKIQKDKVETKRGQNRENVGHK